MVGVLVGCGKKCNPVRIRIERTKDGHKLEQNLWKTHFRRW